MTDLRLAPIELLDDRHGGDDLPQLVIGAPREKPVQRALHAGDYDVIQGRVVVQANEAAGASRRVQRKSFVTARSA